MHDASLPRELRKHVQARCDREAGVDDNGKAFIRSELKLTLERSPLQRLVRSVILEIQPDLADRDGSASVRGEKVAELVDVVDGCISTVLRVNPKGCCHVRLLLSKTRGTFRCSEVDAGRNEPYAATGSKPLEDIAAVGVKLGRLDMRMCVDEHTFVQWMSAPSGKVDMGVNRAISSSTEAASNMPCDVMPLSFRGWRFATTTICLPTRDAGS